jgi:hypothetical protein
MLEMPTEEKEKLFQNVSTLVVIEMQQLGMLRQVEIYHFTICVVDVNASMSAASH